VLLTKVASSFDGKLAIGGDYKGRLVIFDGQQTGIVESPVGQASRPAEQP
jgi:hypothetical protein